MFARRVCLTLAVALSSPCASTRGGGPSVPSEGPDGEVGRSPSVVIVAVTNRGFSDVLVYLAGGYAPVRLGRVAALERVELIVPRTSLMADPIRLLLRRAGSNEEFAPEPLWARPGEVVQLTIQPRLSTSQMTLR